MAWFGPKGVATMTFSLFVLGPRASPTPARIFIPRRPLRVRLDVPPHGLTDTPGQRWWPRRTDPA